MVALLFAEALTFGFFAILAYTGWQVLQVLEGVMLVSLTWVPVQITQSVIPIGAVLFLICQLLSLPEYWSKTARGISLEHAEIEEEVEAELKKAGAR
jgi:TRAP-type C4-dicarboxylate transport system permease small subunit